MNVGILKILVFAALLLVAGYEILHTYGSGSKVTPITHSHALHVGDRVEVFGGYEANPDWSKGHGTLVGEVLKFIPGQNKEPALVLRISPSIESQGVAGDVLILELRYAGATWATEGIVHLELCDFMPEDKSWSDRQQGQWIESHAKYRLLAGG